MTTDEFAWVREVERIATAAAKAARHRNPTTPELEDVGRFVTHVTPAAVLRLIKLLREAPIAETPRR